MVEIQTRSASACECMAGGFLAYLAETSAARIATLGPRGTSSQLAAVFLADKFLKDGSVDLFGSFEEAFEAVVEMRADLLVVPHAYGNINRFYTDLRAEPQFIFFHETPTYGLARRRRHFPSSHLRIACHPAVGTLVPSMLGNLGLVPDDATVITAPSNSAAAVMVQDGDVDLAITNESSVNEYGLEFISVHGPLKLSWTAFSRKSPPVQ